MSKAKALTEVKEKGFTTQGDRLKYQKLVKEAGVEKTLAVYGHSYAECYKKMAEKEQKWRAAVIQNRELAVGHVKLYEAMRGYFDSNRQYIKDNSYISKLTRLENQIKPSALARKYADQITHNEIQKLIDDLAEAGYSKSTVKHTKELFTEYYENLYGRYSQLNPATNLKLPRFDEEVENEVSEATILEDDEIKLFFKQCDAPSSPHHYGCHYSDMFKFLILTYIRSGEACALQVKDFKSLPDGTGRISINKTITKAYENEKVSYKLGSPKTKTSRRTIKISKIAADIIRNRIAGKKPTDFIWSQADGNFLKPSNTCNAFKKVLAKSGINKTLRLHDLRHSGISFAIRHHPEQLVNISKLAGHKSIAITADIYYNFLQSSTDATADLISVEFNNILEKAAS